MRRLILAALLRWRMPGWRSVSADPPPIGQLVLGHCDYTGVRMVTARRDDIHFRRWDHWHINHPTHWQPLPAALERAPEPQPHSPIYVSNETR